MGTLDAAIALWGSIRSVPYNEFLVPVPQDCCANCPTCPKCSCFSCCPQGACCECTIPKKEKQNSTKTAVKGEWNKQKKEASVASGGCGIEIGDILDIFSALGINPGDIFVKMLVIFGMCGKKIQCCNVNYMDKNSTEAVKSKRDMVDEVQYHLKNAPLKLIKNEA